MTSDGPSNSGASDAPTIHQAECRTNGDVVKKMQISEPEAVQERKAGRDVVVCGDDVAANRELAKQIEYRAHGSYKRCGAHASAGPNALNHFQPDPRNGVTGHSFYETKGRKAKTK